MKDAPFETRSPQSILLDRFIAMRMAETSANVQPGDRRAFRNLRMMTSASKEAVARAIK